MICYSREFGFYVELCEVNEDAAAFVAYGDSVGDWSCIRICEHDVRHAHQTNGECIKVIAPEQSRAASDMRLRMGRAFVSGKDFVRS